TKDFVSLGASVQESAGEMFWPSQVNRCGIEPSCEKAGLVIFICPPIGPLRLDSAGMTSRCHRRHLLLMKAHPHCVFLRKRIGVCLQIRKETTVPEKDDEAALQRAKQDEKEGKAPTTQAGEFVREEIHHVREGKHGARSPQQAIAIGLSKARRAGVNLPPPADPELREKAKRDLSKGR